MLKKRKTLFSGARAIQTLQPQNGSEGQRSKHIAASWRCELAGHLASLASVSPSPSPHGVTDIMNGKCFANPEVLHDMRGQCHPQEQICHNQASCTQNPALTTLAKGVLPSAQILASGRTPVAPNHSPSSSHMSSDKYESCAALPCVKSGALKMKPTHAPRPTSPASATFSPTLAPHFLHYNTQVL